MKEDIRYCISLNNEHKGMFREKNTSPTADIPVWHHPWLRCVCAQGDMRVNTQHRLGAHVDTRVNAQHHVGACRDTHVNIQLSCGYPHGHACQHSRGIHVRTLGALQGCRSSISLQKLLFWLELCYPNKIF